MSTMQSRSYYQEIHRKAAGMARIEGLNEDWKAAYERLASAADHLDAMTARSSVRIPFDEALAPKTMGE